MLEIFHVSDLHYGQSNDQNKKAQALLDGISRQYPFKDCDNRYLLVTGDFTQGGREDEYKLAMQALMPFKGRVFVTPGNHDYGSIFGADYSEKKARYFDDPFAKTLEFPHSFINKKVFNCRLNFQSDSLMMIGLNSCAKKGVFDFAQGEIGDKQIRELDKLLTDADAQIPKLVFLHHIPHKDAAFEFVMTLRDWEELMAVVNGRIDALAFGHQGKVLDIEQRGKTGSASAHRPMQVRSLTIPREIDLKRGIIKHAIVLDADGSVANQAFYHIKVKNNKLTATVELANPVG